MAQVRNCALAGILTDTDSSSIHCSGMLEMSLGRGSLSETPFCVWKGQSGRAVDLRQLGKHA